MDDLPAWHTAPDARISPDGQWVAWIDQVNGASRLHLLSVTNGSPVALATGAGDDRAPRFSFDSLRLLWVSRTGGERGTTRITVRRMDTGAETVIANLPVEPLAVVPAPEGEALAFTARVPVEGGASSWVPPALLPRLARAEHVAVFLLTNPLAAPKRLSTGDFDYPGEPAWIPDGQTVLAARAGGEIVGFRITGGEKALTQHAGRNESPLPSPDSARIAWLAADPQPSGYAIRQLRVMNADGSRMKILSGSLDRDAADPQWSSDARTVYFLAGDHGYTHVYAARNDGSTRPLPGENQRLAGLSLADDGTAVSVRATAAASGEIIAFPTDRASSTRVLVSPNRDLLATRTLGAVEEISYSSDGQAIQAWLTRPPGFSPERKTPLLLDIRGEDGDWCSGAFDLRSQILAARGFAVLCVNPRGTPGYGEQFGNLLPTRYPDGAADDLLRGVDAAIAKGGIDAQRVYATGGLLCAWLIGHTDRIAAAVARHAVADLAMAAVLDPERRLSAWLGALPWEDPEAYARRSPLASAARFRTPTLVIQEGDDPQAAALYKSLEARRVEAALLRFSAVSTPARRMEEWQAELAWLARH